MPQKCRPKLPNPRKLGTVALSGVLGIFLWACREPIEFRSREASINNPASGPTWHGPTALDLGDVRDPATDEFYGKNSDANLSDWADTSSPEEVAQSFGDFRLASSASYAGLMTSLYDGTRFRAFGRIYNPRNLGGSGWASYGPQGSFLEVNSTAPNYTNVAASISPGGIFLSLFDDDQDTQQATFGVTGAWSEFRNSIQTAITNLGATSFFAGHNAVGYTSSVAWDSLGRAYLGFIDKGNNPKAYVLSSSDRVNWSSPRESNNALGITTTGTITESVQQIKLLNDGLGVTAIWLGSLNPVPTGTSSPNVQTSWSLDRVPLTGEAKPFGSSLSGVDPTTLSSQTSKNFEAATDGNGNVLVVFIQQMPGYTPPASDPESVLMPIRNRDFRVYASVRGATGTWVGPTRIDDQFDVDTTTLYQDSRGVISLTEAVGGIDYPKLGVAHLGSGRFLVAFPMTDLISRTSGIYVRGYTVGKGWDATSETYKLDSLTIPSSASEAFRYGNELELASDGQGNALLVAHVVVPSDEGATLSERHYGLKVYRYESASGGWKDPYLIPNSICRARTTSPYEGTSPPTVPPDKRYFCWTSRAQAALFPGGEAVVGYPAPAAASEDYADNLRLYSMEYYQ